MRAHHVIAFHEGLHGELPIGRQLDRPPAFHPEILDIARIHPRRDRAKALQQRGRIIVVVDEGAATPELHPARHQVEFRRLKILLIENPAAVDEGILAIHVPAPAMEWADEPRLLAITALHDELHAAMPAGIMEGFHARLGAHHNNGFIEVLILDIITDLRNLLQPAGQLPDMRPEMLALQIEEFLVVIALRGNPLGMGDPERYLAQGRSLALRHPILLNVLCFTARSHCRSAGCRGILS